MDCNVIQDLIPLYVDRCCSDKSAELVKEHLTNCPVCAAVYESMHKPEMTDVTGTSTDLPYKKELQRIREFRGSILNSVLLIVSFAVITVGVALESATPNDGPRLVNGYWAFTLVIPATGFLLSLTNWFFARFYKSRKLFSTCTMLVVLLFVLGATVWAALHYSFIGGYGFIITVSEGLRFLLMMTWRIYPFGFLLTTVFCAVAKLLSNLYAKMLGKE